MKIIEMDNLFLIPRNIIFVVLMIEENVQIQQLVIKHINSLVLDHLHFHDHVINHVPGIVTAIEKSTTTEPFGVRDTMVFENGEHNMDLFFFFIEK